MDIYNTINYYGKDQEFIERIKQSQEASITGIRCNLCKYSIDEIGRVLQSIEKNIKKIDSNINIIIDLPYPHNKARIDGFNFDGEIIKDKQYIIKTKDTDTYDSDNVIFMGQDCGYASVAVGSILYYADGDGAFEVVSNNKDFVQVIAKQSFTIGKTKSISFEHADESSIDFSILFKELNAICLKNIVFLLSFVKNKDDILNIKSNITVNKKVVAKIETKEAINDLDNIAQVADGLMIARGDLGLTDSAALFDNIEKICMTGKKYNIPVMCATDILLSMDRNYIPNRAEIIDITYIIKSGCRSVVLKDGDKNIARVKDFINEISGRYD